MSDLTVGPEANLSVGRAEAPTTLQGDDRAASSGPTLRPYQEQAVAFLLERDRAIEGDAPGIGKTATVISALSRRSPQPSPVLVLAPLSVVRHWETEMGRWSGYRAVVGVGSAAQRREARERFGLYWDNECLSCGFPLTATHGAATVGIPCSDHRARPIAYITNYEAAKADRLNLFDIPWQAVVCDEVHRCFPGATRVLTDEGWLPIREIVENGRGTSVLSCDTLFGETRWRPITRRWRNPATPLVRIHHTKGELVCTSTHKVWTSDGFKEAGLLTSTDSLWVVPQEVSASADDEEVLFSRLRDTTPNVLAGISGEHHTEKHQASREVRLPLVRENLLRPSVPRGAGVLLKLVQFQIQTRHDSKPNEQSRDAGENAADVERAWSRSDTSGREWEANARTAETSSRSVGLADRSLSEDETYPRTDGSTADVLQDRHRQRGTHARDRGGRFITQREGTPGTRREERQSVVSARVESVEIYEPGSDGELLDGTSDDRYLYDIEVKEDHNYFAEGVLVSNCRNRKTQVFKVVRQLALPAPIFIGISGTPVVNRADDLWALMHLCRPKEWKSYWGFVNDFMESQTTTFNGKLAYPIKQVTGMRPGMDGVLRQHLRDVMIRRSLSELLPELPEVIETIYEVDLSEQERKAYDQLEKKFFADMPDGSKVIAPNDVAKITRLRQLSTDWSVLGASDTGSTKVKRLFELLEDIGDEQVVIFSAFSSVIDPIAAALNAGKITGDVKSNDRTDVMRAFREGHLQYMCGTIAAMGEGIDLQSARHVVFLDLHWAPAGNEQCIARVHRYGQRADAVFVHTIAARNTIDSYIARTIASKQAIIDAVVGLAWNEVIGGSAHGS